MDDKKAARTNFRVLFLKKLDRDGTPKTMGDLTRAIMKASGKALVRAGKRAFDFRQPSLPGLPPRPNQDLPALPPPQKEKGWKSSAAPEATPSLSGTEKALSRSTDWRKSRIWMWISGGGWKGLLGARRYWAQAARYFLDALGRLAWTFRLFAIEPLKFATRHAALMFTAFADFRRFRDAGLYYRPHSPTLKKIFRYCALPPIAGGFAMLLETWFLSRLEWIPAWLYYVEVLAGISAIAFPIFLWYWCLEDLPRRHPWQKWPLEMELEKIKNGVLAGFAIPAFVHSAPGSIPSCFLGVLFGSSFSGGQSACQSGTFVSFVSQPQILNTVPAAVSVVASLVSILALFLLSVTYGYHLVQAMHTAAHTGDWTHQSVNAAWAPVRGATSAAMIAAPAGVSILGAFVLFVASTGNGVGDTAASKIANQLVAPSVSALVPPNVQVVIDDALFSLTCAHVLDNFVNPQGTIQAVTAQPDNFGGIGFSNVAGVGSYGNNVCGYYSIPSGTGITMAQNQAFLAMVRPGGPLDQAAAAIASGVNGCNSIVIGTGLSPCAPAGTPPNRSVYAQGGGMTNPAAGQVGTLTQVARQFVGGLVQQGQTATGTNSGSTPAPISEIQTEGWSALGNYYKYFADQSNTWAQFVDNLPVSSLPDFSSIAGSEAQTEVQRGLQLARYYITNYGFAGVTNTFAGAPFWMNQPIPTSAVGTDQVIAASLSQVYDPATGGTASLPSYMSSNLGEDPLTKFQSVVNMGDMAVAGGAAVEDTIGSLVAKIPVVGGILSSPFSMSKNGDPSKIDHLIDGAIWIMAILTFLAGTYLPYVPLIAIFFYMVEWVLEVSILVLFAPLWALAVGIPQGEGFIGQHGKEGLSRVTDIALRPVLLVGMFALSLGLYYLISDGLVLLVSQASSQTNQSTGMWYTLVEVLAMFILYMIVLWRSIHFAFEIIHTGPFWAMRVLGIDGGQRREGREGQEMKGSFKEIGQNVTTIFRGFTVPGKKG
jgi:conjugal transfer/type IV secretion protein DotA/TraY